MFNWKIEASFAQCSDAVISKVITVVVNAETEVEALEKASMVVPGRNIYLIQSVIEVPMAEQDRLQMIIDGLGKVVESLKDK